MTGNTIQKDMEDGLTSKMIIEQCILLSWNQFGGSSKRSLKQEEFIENVKLCPSLVPVILFFPILKHFNNWHELRYF